MLVQPGTTELKLVSPNIRSTSSSFRESYNQQQSISSSGTDQLPVYGYVFFIIFLVCMWTAMLFPTVVHFFPNVVSHGSHGISGDGSHHMIKQHSIPHLISSSNGHSLNHQDNAMKMHQSDMTNLHSQNSTLDHFYLNNSARANDSRTGARTKYDEIHNKTEPMLLDKILNKDIDNLNVYVDNGSMVIPTKSKDVLSLDGATKADNILHSKSNIPVRVTDVPPVNRLSVNVSQCLNYTGGICSEEFFRISAPDLNIEKLDRFISSAAERLKSMNESTLVTDECYRGTIRYLCRKVFSDCGTEDKTTELQKLKAELIKLCSSKTADQIEGIILKKPQENQTRNAEISRRCKGPTEEVNGTCLLLCSWDAFPPKSQTANSVVFSVALVISTLSCGIIFISYMQITVMKKFPHVIPIYISLASTTSMWIVGIPFIVGPYLYCSQQYIVQQDEYSGSVFCTVQGFLFQYCIIAQSKWFCCLVYNIYQATVSTQKFSSNDYMMRRLHIFQSCICWMLPLLLCCIGISYEGYGNHHGNKQVCVLKNKNMHYYTLVLPVQISTLLSGTLLSFSVFFMKKSEIKSHSSVSRKRSMALGQKPPIHIVNKIEKKLMGLSASFVILNAFLLTRLTFCIHQRVDLDNALKEYTKCLGDVTRTDCPTSTYIHFLHPEVSIVCNLVLGLYPAVVLIFLPSNKLLLVLWRKRVLELLGLLGLSTQSVSEFSNFRFSESGVLNLRRDKSSQQTTPRKEDKSIVISQHHAID
ncbi:hypothetical protein ACHWQZ_G004386 [Mnemiopsis leidyi]